MRFRSDFPPRVSHTPLSSALVLLFLALANTGPVAWSGSKDISSEPARLPDSLEPILPSYTVPIETVLRRFKQGVEHYLAARYAAALAALPNPEDANAAAIADYIVLYRAKAHLMLEDAPAALEEFQSIQRNHPGSSQFQNAVLGEVQALLRLREFQAALQATRNPKVVENSDVLYFRARAHEESGNTREALAYYLRVYTDFVNSDVASLTLDRLQALSPRFMGARGNTKALLQRAANLIRAGKNREAESLLLKLAHGGETDIHGRETRELLLGEARVNLGKATAALLHLKKVGEADRERHARALYLRAQAYRRLKKEDSFLAVRNAALAAHPQSPATESILYSVATYFELARKHEEAKAAYQAIADGFPKGTHARRARWKTALYAYAERDYPEALAGFWKYLVAHASEGDVSAPVYWIGRCYERLGDKASALALYARARGLANESYYGQRARESEAALREPGRPSSPSYEGLDFTRLSRLLDGLTLPRPSLSDPSPQAARIIERARQLAVADLPDLALAELRWGLQRFPQEKALSYVMSRIFEMKRDYYGVISTLRRAFPTYDDQPRGRLPQELWSLLFPVLHWQTIRTLSERNEVDPTLVLAIIRQESAFYEQARSRANARGLMQVRPSTARQTARAAGVQRYSTQKLYSAETNLALGIYYLSSLLRQFQGRVDLALAAYNAGDSRVDGWLKEFGDVEMDEFIERVPFSETRTYIKQVMTNQAHYRRLAGGTASPAS